MQFDVKIRNVIENGKPLKALASVTVDGSFTIHNVRVIKTENAQFVAMPYYNDIIYPNELWRVHPKSAITKRNQWMIDNSDALIAYVEHEGDGAARCLHMAEKREIEIIRL